MEAFLSGVVAGFGIAIPVGAIAILIIQVAIKCGTRCAFFAGAGAATADLAYASLAVIGGAALSQGIDSVEEAFRYLSAGVLVVIAVLGLLRARSPIERSEFSLPAELAGTFFRFLGLTIINPTTVVYFAAVVVGLGLASGLTVGGGLAFVAGAFLASLSWQTLLAIVGGFAGARLTPGMQTAAIIAGNLLILILALVIVWT